MKLRQNRQDLQSGRRSLDQQNRCRIHYIWVNCLCSWWELLFEVSYGAVLHGNYCQKSCPREDFRICGILWLKIFIGRQITKLDGVYSSDVCWAGKKFLPLEKLLTPPLIAAGTVLTYVCRMTGKVMVGFFENWGIGRPDQRRAVM